MSNTNTAMDQLNFIILTFPTKKQKPTPQRCGPRGQFIKQK
jgi:hypothetical protein